LARRIFDFGMTNSTLRLIWNETSVAEAFTDPEPFLRHLPGVGTLWLDYVDLASPCYTVATQGPYGGVLSNLGNLFADTTVTGAGYGVIEIYSAEQVSPRVLMPDTRHAAATTSPTWSVEVHKRTTYTP
jgi:hypothetical protein